MPLWRLLAYRHLLLGSCLEGGASGKIAKKNLPVVFELISDEAETQKEATECIFFVINRFFFGGDPFLIPCHVAEFADKIVVGNDFFGGGFSGEPGEADLMVSHFNGQILDTQGFPNEIAFCINDAVKIGKIGIRENGTGHGNADPGELVLRRIDTKIDVEFL